MSMRCIEFLAGRIEDCSRDVWVAVLSLRQAENRRVKFTSSGEVWQFASIEAPPQRCQGLRRSRNLFWNGPVANDMPRSTTVRHRYFNEICSLRSHVPGERFLASHEPVCGSIGRSDRFAASVCGFWLAKYRPVRYPDADRAFQACRDKSLTQQPQPSIQSVPVSFLNSWTVFTAPVLLRQLLQPLLQVLLPYPHWTKQLTFADVFRMCRVEISWYSLHGAGHDFPEVVPRCWKTASQSAICSGMSEPAANNTTKSTTVCLDCFNENVLCVSKCPVGQHLSSQDLVCDPLLRKRVVRQRCFLKLSVRVPKFRRGIG